MTSASVALPVAPPVRPIVPAAVVPTVAPVVPAVRPVAPAAITPPWAPVAPPGFQDVRVARRQARLSGSDLRYGGTNGREAGRNARPCGFGGGGLIDGLARRGGEGNGDAECAERQQCGEGLESAAWRGHGRATIQRWNRMVQPRTCHLPPCMRHRFTIKDAGCSSSTNMFLLSECRTAMIQLYIFGNTCERHAD